LQSAGNWVERQCVTSEPSPVLIKTRMFVFVALRQLKLHYKAVLFQMNGLIKDKFTGMSLAERAEQIVFRKLSVGG